MTDDKQTITDPSDLRKYRTELPNLYDDAELDVYEFRLLAHYKRVGKCTEGLETTAVKCKMSEGKASEVRQSLADKRWINLQRIAMDAGRYRYVVEVADRWIENFARYSGLSEQDILAQLKAASPSPREASPSPREGKKELIKNLDIRFGEVAQKLSELTGGLNSKSADVIGTWLEKHTNEWIFKAIEIARDKGARSVNYVDSILIGWEANGYPKSRDEKIAGAKHANSNASDSKRTEPRKPKANLSPDDLAAAARINARQTTNV